MKRFFVICLAAMAFAQFAFAAPPLAKPQLLAVYFYADWCPNCKALSPIIAEARLKGELDKKPILFVTMNLTDKATIHQSILMASQLGMGDYLKAQGSKTGYIAILDAASKKELSRFDRSATAVAIRQDVESRLH